MNDLGGDPKEVMDTQRLLVFLFTLSEVKVTQTHVAVSSSHLPFVAGAGGNTVDHFYLCQVSCFSKPIY